MNAVRITVMPAFRPAPGLIGVNYAKPPIIERTIYDAKLPGIDTELATLCAYAETQPGEWMAVVRVIDGRKPAGFDAAKQAGRFTKDGNGATV